MIGALDVRGAQPLHQAGDLDVVCLVAVLREPCGIGGDEGEALDRAAEADVAVRRIEAEGNAAPFAERQRAAVVIEGGLPHALLPEQVEIDIGEGDAVAIGEAVGFSQNHAVFADGGLAVP